VSYQTKCQAKIDQIILKVHVGKVIQMNHLDATMIY